jgi:hypothetical protein
VLVFGDKGCGKRSLIKQMNKPFQKYLPANKLDDFGSNFANFDCNFLYYRDISEGGRSTFEEMQ